VVYFIISFIIIFYCPRGVGQWVMECVVKALSDVKVKIQPC
jgi:hypothetical protein